MIGRKRHASREASFDTSDLASPALLCQREMLQVATRPFQAEKPAVSDQHWATLCRCRPERAKATRNVLARRVSSKAVRTLDTIILYSFVYYFETPNHHEIDMAIFYGFFAFFCARTLRNAFPKTWRCYCLAIVYDNKNTLLFWMCSMACSRARRDRRSVLPRASGIWHARPPEPNPRWHRRVSSTDSPSFESIQQRGAEGVRPWYAQQTIYNERAVTACIHAVIGRLRASKNAEY